MSGRYVTRLAITPNEGYADFRRRFEATVPALDPQRLADFVKRKASWDEVVTDANTAAPLGFFLFWCLDVAPTMSLNGNAANCCEYLMGNHVIAERAFRHDPMAMLYVPLRIVLFQKAGSSTTFVIEQPSSLLSSLGNTDITLVGLELDKKLADLFKHLEVPCPQQLLGA
jgi:Domain of unknown function DUF302